MRDHKVSARYKDRHMEVVRREMEKVHNKLELLANSCRRTRVIHRKICELLDLRGIDSEDEWATLCSRAEATNTWQVVNVRQALGTLTSNPVGLSNASEPKMKKPQLEELDRRTNKKRHKKVRA
ncbi:toxin-antitoxin system, antitoxin component, ribbon-helix-helix domain protein [Cooperia oncophora]